LCSVFDTDKRHTLFEKKKRRRKKTPTKTHQTPLNSLDCCCLLGSIFLFLRLTRNTTKALFFPSSSQIWEIALDAKCTRKSLSFFSKKEKKYENPKL
tara:strand:- start:255 stop:545 length:291 start_codon:yes stop_codon:yes gene_type:complete